jgi:hypothetical protein
MKEEIKAHVPDFYDWPHRWMGVDEDLAYGEKLLKHFEPFVFEITTGQLAKKTKKKHIDNLWLAGGELIRRISDEENYNIDPKELILECFGDDGGLYCRHLETEDQFKSYDSSCRKFYKFMKQRGNQSD